MPKRRTNGEGNIRKRKDGRWEGRYTAGCDAEGKRIIKQLLLRNPSDACMLPKAEKQEMKILPAEQMGSYLHATEQRGVDVKTVSSMLGHSNAGFTLNTYTHATKKTQEAAAEKVGAFMKMAL